MFEMKDEHFRIDDIDVALLETVSKLLKSRQSPGRVVRERASAQLDYVIERAKARPVSVVIHESTAREERPRLSMRAEALLASKQEARDIENIVGPDLPFPLNWATGMYRVKGGFWRLWRYLFPAPQPVPVEVPVPVEAPKKKRILLVCSGNTCRSPMAEGIARQMLGDGFEVESAGLHAGSGSPVAFNAASVMDERGIDISNHASRRLPEDLSGYDLVVSFAGSVNEFIRRGANEAIFRYVSDPIGGDLGKYAATADQIGTELRSIFKEKGWL
jgi:protein-tyrosine-phosphatase